MAKSADAFRTISEVADWLGVPTHVLRFWESKFPQVKPVKRAGGRRYYRPSDMLLLAGIRVLLHDDGMTIRGVQKILREKGVKHVTGLADREVAGDLPDADISPVSSKPETSEPAPEADNIVDLRRNDTPRSADPKAPASEATPSEPVGTASASDDSDQMPLFGGGADSEVPPEPTKGPEDVLTEPAPEVPVLPGASPVGGPSLRPLLDQLAEASPEAASEIRTLLASQKDKLLALRERLATPPTKHGSDTDI